MAEIRHHLTDAILMGYAAGTLPEAFGLVVATHVSLCDDCRARLAEFEAIGGELLEDAGEVAVAEESLAMTMARITAMPQDPPAPRVRHDHNQRRKRPVFPAPLRDYVGGDADDVRWRRLAGGVSQMVLPINGGGTARLLRIPGGVAVPDHGHRGLELTLVLQGAFRDEKDRFGPGDVEVADEDFNHRPVAEEGAVCLCLAATDAPLKFSSVIPRLAQPFLRI